MPEDIDTQLAALHDQVEAVGVDVRATRAQAEKTNGRVNVHADQLGRVFQVLDGHQVGTRTVPGLIERLENLEPLAREVRSARKVGWVLALAVLAQIGTNLANTFG